MKKITKLIAAAVATATLTLSFTGCGLVKNTKDITSAKDARKAAADKEEQMTKTVLKIGDKITVDGAYYGYYFSMVKNEMLQAQSSESSASSDASKKELPKLDLNKIKEEAQKRIISTKTAYQKALDEGIKLTDKDNENISNNIDQIKSGVKKQGISYAKFVEAMDTTTDAISRAVKEEYMGNLYFASLVSDKFVSAKHILIQMKSETVTDEKALPEADALKKANEIKAKLDNGEDFDKLMKENSMDPGLETAPDGYTFTKGQMVEEFENATYALEIDEVSAPVKTSYGFHIIKRIKTDMSGVANALASASDEGVTSVINAEKEKLTADAKATETDAIKFYKAD